MAPGPDGSLPAETELGPVTLAVAHLDETAAFYERAIGLRVLERSARGVALGAGSRRLLELLAAPDAAPPPRRSTGLFHLALLVPDRRELASAIERITSAGARFTGASDHLVSEALYLDDPEGNGIEIYRDRPRSTWERVGGEVRMITAPLDVDAVLAELPDRAAATGPLSADTTIGHVHLRVADLTVTEAFYAGALGLDVTVRAYPGALFLSAGGYHHHIGANTWLSEGAAPPPDDSRGLRRFEIALPKVEDVELLRGRLGALGVYFEEADGALLVQDPSGLGLRVAAAT